MSTNRVISIRRETIEKNLNEFLANNSNLATFLQPTDQELSENLMSNYNWLTQGGMLSVINATGFDDKMISEVEASKESVIYINFSQLPLTATLEHELDFIRMIEEAPEKFRKALGDRKLIASTSIWWA